MANSISLPKNARSIIVAVVTISMTLGNVITTVTGA